LELEKFCGDVPIIVSGEVGPDSVMSRFGTARFYLWHTAPLGPVSPKCIFFYLRITITLEYSM